MFQKCMSWFFVLLICAGACAGAGSDEGDSRPTPRVTVSGEGWPDAVPAATASLRLVFPYPIDGSEAAAELRDAADTVCPVRIVPGSDGRSLDLTATNLAADSAYRLSVSGHRDTDGRVLPPYAVSFRTAPTAPLPDLALVAAFPVDGAERVAPGTEALLLAFNEAVDCGKISAVLTWETNTLSLGVIPATGHTNALSLAVPGGLPADTLCRVRITGLVGRSGKTIETLAYGFSTAAAPQEKRLVLSELCTGFFAVESAYDEFVEIYNLTAQPIDLVEAKIRLYRASASGASWTLLCDFQKAEHFVGDAIPNRRVIPAHGFYLVVNERASEDLLVVADALVKGSRMSLTDNATLALTAGGTPKTSGATLDLLGNGTAALFEGNAAAPLPGKGASLERKAVFSSDWNTMRPGGVDALRGNAFDSDQNAVDWILRLSPAPQNSFAAAEIPW